MAMSSARALSMASAVTMSRLEIDLNQVHRALCRLPNETLSCQISGQDGPSCPVGPCPMPRTGSSWVGCKQPPEHEPHPNRVFNLLSWASSILPAW